MDRQSTSRADSVVGHQNFATLWVGNSFKGSRYHPLESMSMAVLMVGWAWDKAAGRGGCVAGEGAAVDVDGVGAVSVVGVGVAGEVSRGGSGACVGVAVGVGGGVVVSAVSMGMAVEVGWGGGVAGDISWFAEADRVGLLVG